MKYTVDENGFYGEFGGAFVPEMLYPNVRELQLRYRDIIESEEFQREFRRLLKDYVGRPSPLYLAERLSEKIGFRTYLKREDLNHTGAHKINNTIGQILLARALGKKRIIAETGAGQHGLATATVCALMNLECVVFMGAVDIERQKPNVEKMQMLGARVVPVNSGSKTLKDATNEALRDWIADPIDTHYLIGSVVGPHPFPDMVARFQRVIGEEIRAQLIEKEGRETPDAIVACVGGGSNAIGAFGEFLEDERVKLFGVEAGGEGVSTKRTAATTAVGKAGVLHGSRTLLIQTEDGQVREAHSVSAGLDYPGIGAQHSYLHATGRVNYVNVTDEEALAAGLQLTRLEGIIPAVESAHALAYLPKLNTAKFDIAKDSVVVVCLSGRGDKDMATYLEYFKKAGNDNAE
jgi:tryptophan synthase beta chain